MPRYPETRALMEQALRDILSVQGKLLKRSDAAELTKVLAMLNGLAINTNNQLVEGFHRLKKTKRLTQEARRIEKQADDLSESLWRPILEVEVSKIYERVEDSFAKQPGELGMAADTRAHYHNLRFRLLEQLLSARMLAQNSDLGDENERIWQQFLQRHLGPMFRVLRGGHICDHQGNTSCQLDLIVVRAEAQVFVPGDSDDGKTQVLIDQVISAIMVKSNLTAAELKKDWRKLQSIPAFPEMEKDHAHFKGHPWPLCYILAAQSDSADDLVKAWKQVCREGHRRIITQFVVVLDTGFLYCGLRRWPCPRYPGNFTEAEDVLPMTGIYAGLGLAWLLTQHQGRLAMVQRQGTGSINRFASLLDLAMLGEATPLGRFFLLPPTMEPLMAVIEWGRIQCWAHNRLPLNSLRLKQDGAPKVWWEVELLLPGVKSDATDSHYYTKQLRWFHHGVTKTAGRLVAFEEWLNHKSKTDHKRRIAVFDRLTGEEVTAPSVDALTAVSEVESIRAAIEAELLSSPVKGDTPP